MSVHDTFFCYNMTCRYVRKDVSQKTFVTFLFLKIVSHTNALFNYFHIIMVVIFSFVLKITVTLGTRVLNCSQYNSVIITMVTVSY